MSDLSLLSNGGTVVIVGGRESNFRDHWNHPLFRFMEPSDANRHGLPANAKGIVFTRFMGHKDMIPIMTEARKRNLVVFPFNGTGQLKTLLDQLIASAKPKLIVHPEDQPLKTPKPDPLPVSVPKPVMNEPAIASSSRVMTTTQVANFLGVSPSAVSLWRVDGKLVSLGKKKIMGLGGKTVEQYTFDPVVVEAFRQKHNPIGKPQQKKKNGARPVRKYTKRASGTPTPWMRPKGKTESPNVLVEMVDQAIAALQLIREEVLKTSTSRAMLLERLEKLLS